VKQTGLDNTINAVKTRATAFRKACQAHGWGFSADEQSNCLTGIYLARPVKPLVTKLQEMEVYVMPCRHENMIRVAHTGCLTVADELELAEEIAKWEKTVSE
jgi:aspartate aminotransferase-like enzyme